MTIEILRVNSIKLNSHYDIVFLSQFLILNSLIVSTTRNEFTKRSLSIRFLLLIDTLL